MTPAPHLAAPATRPPALVYGLHCTIVALERTLAALPPSGAARRRAVDALTVAVRRDHGAQVTVRGCAARVVIHGIGATGVGVDGALRNWCAVARGA